MDYRYLGETGLRVSRLAFGTMSFGKEADERESAALYATCREAGINLFDCADVYAKGRSEEILGSLMRGHRDEILLATKGSFPMAPHPNACGASRSHLIRACEASLKRLQTDRIDIYYVHRFDPQTRLEETLRGLEQLVRDGKILYPAVSNFAAYQTQAALDFQRQANLTPLACIQPMYNLLKRQAESEILPMARDNRLAVFPYSPLAAGLLTGKYLGKGASPDSRMLTSKTYQVRYGQLDAQGVAEAVVNKARELGVTPAALAIAWVMRHPTVTAPLLGARSVEQLRPCLAASNLTLSDAEYAALSALTPEPAPATDRHDDGTEHDLWRR